MYVSTSGLGCCDSCASKKRNGKLFAEEGLAGILEGLSGLGDCNSCVIAGQAGVTSIAQLNALFASCGGFSGPGGSWSCQANSPTIQAPAPVPVVTQPTLVTSSTGAPAVGTGGTGVAPIPISVTVIPTTPIPTAQEIANSVSVTDQQAQLATSGGTIDTSSVASAVSSIPNSWWLYAGLGVLGLALFAGGGEN